MRTGAPRRGDRRKGGAHVSCPSGRSWRNVAERLRRESRREGTGKGGKHGKGWTSEISPKEGVGTRGLYTSVDETRTFLSCVKKGFASK